MPKARRTRSSGASHNEPYSDQTTRVCVFQRFSNEQLLAAYRPCDYQTQKEELSTGKRKRKGRNRSNPPRPLNQYFLYRETWKKLLGRNPSGPECVLITNTWNELNRSEKDRWDPLFEFENLAHKEAYPTYQFAPVHERKASEPSSPKRRRTSKATRRRKPQSQGASASTSRRSTPDSSLSSHSASSVHALDPYAGFQFNFFANPQVAINHRATEALLSNDTLLTSYSQSATSSWHIRYTGLASPSWTSSAASYSPSPIGSPEGYAATFNNVYQQPFNHEEPLRSEELRFHPLLNAGPWLTDISVHSPVPIPDENQNTSFSFTELLQNNELDDLSLPIELPPLQFSGYDAIGSY